VKHRRSAFIIGVVIVAAAIAALALGVNGNAVAAVASAIAAVAAMFSAAESGATARDATRALAWATKPSLGVGLARVAETNLEQVGISNQSPYAIKRAVVSWTTKDGRSGSKTLGGLPAGEPTHTMSGLSYRGASWEPFELAPWVNSTGETVVTVDFWGTQSAIGWRLTTRFTWRAEPYKPGNLTTETLYFSEKRTEPEVEIS
jgi:hypothetical protein